MTVAVNTVVAAEIDSFDSDERRIWLGASFRLKELVKQIPGHLWDKDRERWSVPLTWNACVQLRGVFGETLEIGPLLWAWAVDEKDRVDALMALRTSEESTYTMTALDQKLFPLQQTAVEFMALAGSALLGDSFGAGKSPMSLRALALLESRIGSGNVYPALIVTTDTMKWEWPDEIRKWLPGAAAVVLDGTITKRRKALKAWADGEFDIAVVNWQLLPKHSRLAPFGSFALKDEQKEPKELQEIRPKTVIADEAHYAKNPKAQTTRALWAIGDAAEFRFALTGTPLANVPEDLWSVMRFVAPDEWPTKGTFMDRYVEQEWTPFGFAESTGIKANRREEFFKCLDHRFLRRPRSLVVPGLPERLETRKIEIDMAGVQLKAYEEMRKAMVAELEGGRLVAQNPLQKMLRLTQFASACGELVDPEIKSGKMYRREEVMHDRLWFKCGSCAYEFVVNAADHEQYPVYMQAEHVSCQCGEVLPVVPFKPELKLKTPSNKVEALLDLVDELAGESAIVFSDSRQLAELALAALQRKGVVCSEVTGNVTGAARKAMVDAFQAGQSQIMVLTYGAGGEGLTLTRAAVTIRMQRSWSQIKDLQADGRTDRVGQTKPIQTIDLVTRNSVEQRIAEALAEKRGRLEEIVRDVETLKTWLAK